MLKISEEGVEYKMCDNIDGPSILLKKAKVMSINYANGSKWQNDETKEETLTEKPKKEKSGRKGSGIGWGMVAIAAAIIIAPILFVVYIVSLF